MKQTTTRISNNQIKQQPDKRIGKGMSKEISAYKLAMANACMNCGYDDNR